MGQWKHQQIEDFLRVCVTFAAENPECVYEAYKALNGGIIERVDQLKAENADLACGMITALELTTPKSWDKNRNELTRFIGTLADWFKGAPVEQKLRDWLKEGDA